uniref:CD80-like immunoglobulin C2-set domain-containing protein n=1 Tax=Phlebotomus papatasi TaxID=29031 RepID=A0A1B0DBD4_PHLPP
MLLIQYFELLKSIKISALPEEGPRITGGRPRYQIGDIVRVNCTSGRSKPAAHLNWFINGHQADHSFMRKYDNIVTGREGLETSILGLEFRVRVKHFRSGDMKLKYNYSLQCLATIEDVYWRTNEESVEGDKPQKAPVLESRETVPPSNSRADRVQGMRNGYQWHRDTGTSSSQKIHPDHLALFWIITLACLVSRTAGGDIHPMPLR